LAQVMEQSKLETKRGEGGNPNIASNMASNSYNNPIMADDDRKMPAGPPMMRPMDPLQQQTMMTMEPSRAAASATSPYATAAMSYDSSSVATSAASPYPYAAAAAAAAPNNGTTPPPPMLKAAPTYASASNAATSTPSYAAAGTSGNLTPPSTSPIPNSAAMFDPYSKDAPAPAAGRPKRADSPPTPPTSNLKKMGHAKEAGSSKLSSRFKRSSSTKKMQDKAGLV
jgi:hypothetical protein